MLEREIEAYLVKRVKEMDGVAIKFTSPSRRSSPDRLVILPKAKLFFVELKAPGKYATEAQLRWHQELRDYGLIVYVIDTKELVDSTLEKWK